jgi:hypothetical protein
MENLWKFSLLKSSAHEHFFFFLETCHVNSRFVVVTATLLKFQVFLCVTMCQRVSEERSASICRVKQSILDFTSQKTWIFETICTTKWPCGLRRGSSAAHLLGSWFRIPPGAWMSVSCECCVLSGRGLCDGLIPRPEESYRLWCVSDVCDHETSTKRGGPGPYRAVAP